MQQGQNFAFHDLVFEKECGASDETLANMRRQNAISYEAYKKDAKKRNVVPAPLLGCEK
jgi:hypothetical protein